MPFGDGLIKRAPSRPQESKNDDFEDDDFDSPGRKSSSSSSDINDDFGDSKVDDGTSKLKSSKSSSKIDDTFNESQHSHHSTHSYHSHSKSPNPASHSRSQSRKSHMSESKFEESKDDDVPSYMSKRAKLVSRITEYKTILTEEQKKDLENNNFLNKNDKWKYNLLTKTAEKQNGSGSLTARSVNRSQSARPLSARSSIAGGGSTTTTTTTKKLSTQEYVEKLAVPHKIVNNKKDTLDLYEKVKKVKCTCAKGPCNPLKPGPGCARAKLLYATESEIRECTFKPKITKYKTNEGESKTGFVERMDNDTRTARAKKSDAIGEKEYNMRLDILTCPVCGGKQSYKNYIEGKDKCPTCMKKYKPKKAWGFIATSFLNRNVDYLKKKRNPEMKKKEIDWESRVVYYCKKCKNVQTKDEYMNDIKICPRDGYVYRPKYATDYDPEKKDKNAEETKMNIT